MSDLDARRLSSGLAIARDYLIRDSKRERKFDD